MSEFVSVSIGPHTPSCVETNITINPLLEPAKGLRSILACAEGDSIAKTDLIPLMKALRAVELADASGDSVVSGPLFYTASEAAQIFGIHTGTLYRKVSEGVFKLGLHYGNKLGRGPTFTQRQLLRCLDDQVPFGSGEIVRNLQKTVAS